MVSKFKFLIFVLFLFSLNLSVSFSLNDSNDSGYDYYSEDAIKAYELEKANFEERNSQKLSDEEIQRRGELEREALIRLSKEKNIPLSGLGIEEDNISEENESSNLNNNVSEIIISDEDDKSIVNNIYFLIFIIVLFVGVALFFYFKS